MGGKKVGIERKNREKKCVCITLEVFWGLYLSAGDLRGSWVWCLSRQQARLEAPGCCREVGLTRPGGRELDLSLWALCRHLHLGDSSLLTGVPSMASFILVFILPKISAAPHNSSPLPMGVLQAMVLYKSQTNPSLVTNFKKQNEVEKSGKQLFPISLFLLKRRRMWHEACCICSAFFFLLTQPLQARLSVSPCPRTPGTQAEAEAHPDVAGHLVPSCPKPTLLSQRLACATEEPPWSRAARPLIRNSVDSRPLTHYLHNLSVTLKKNLSPP